MGKTLRGISLDAVWRLSTRGVRGVGERGWCILCRPEGQEYTRASEEADGEVYPVDDLHGLLEPGPRLGDAVLADVHRDDSDPTKLADRR